MNSVNSSAPIAILGDIMMDIDAHVSGLHTLIDSRGSDIPSDISLTCGGSASNTAAWLSHLGSRTILMGAIGEDPAGQYVLDQLELLGVETSIKVDEVMSTGMCIVLTEDDGSRTMIPSAGASGNLSTIDIDLLWPSESISHFHLSAYSLFHRHTREAALHSIRRAKALGATTSLDPSAHTLISHHFPSIKEALLHTDVLLANHEEAVAIYIAMGLRPSPDELTLEEMMNGLATSLWVGRDTPHALVVTLESKGAAALDNSGSITQQPALKIPLVVSTAGAGDAFNAGFLKAWTKDPGAILTAVVSGNSAAAEVLNRVGASPPARY